MWNRKNFIIFALFLNCIYFIGTSILVTRYVNVLEWTTHLEWLEHASEPILHKILFDEQTRESLEKELETFDFKKSIATWATKYQLIHLVELNTKNINWIGSREKIPFNSKHLENRQELGFNKTSDKLLFSYILETKQKTFLISQQIEEQQIKQFLDAYDVDIMIAEKENLNSSRLLYTTLSLPVAQILLEKNGFRASHWKQAFILVAL